MKGQRLEVESEEAAREQTTVIPVSRMKNVKLNDRKVSGCVCVCVFQKDKQC